MFKSSRCRMLVAGTVLMAAAAILWSGCSSTGAPQASGGGKKGQKGGMALSVSVAVAKAETRDLPVYLSGLGSVEAFNTVVVKSRIDGQLVPIPSPHGH